LVVGGTIQATRLALAGRRIAVNLKGGMHHARPERGMGFCVFNDIAVAIRRLQARGLRDRVLVIDLDLHDGNGTRAAFANDPSVHTFSIHNAAWDDGPAVATTSIALGSGVTDERYLAVLRESLPPVVAAHRPGLVIYVAGCDPAAHDRIGDWKITARGMLARDQFVAHLVRGSDLTRPVPLVILTGGGYGASAWRYSARFFAWLVAGRVLEPPGDMELILRRFRRITREFTEAGLAAAPAAGTDDWGLTEEDLGGLAPGAPHETRVLGYYSKHGVELLLERLGFFAKIRALGFRHPVLDVDFGSGLGQTLRIYGGPERAGLLMELRVNRSRRVIPGLDVIFVEWLLLQNPRQPFTERVPRLPGQEHPGLGLLGEVGAWLVVACETIGLDGIAHVPSHFHLAVVGRHHLRFLRPEHQARFEALRDALQGIPIAEASRLLEEDRVVDAATGEPVRWKPGPTVLPVSVRLKALITGPAYTEAVRRAREGMRFRLA
ncbi:MAG: histone deacetylase, partial [Gemmatimonadetes bacterium]|nr:histone deacetylase [Gemmatimonadota bacterium]